MRSRCNPVAVVLDGDGLAASTLIEGTCNRLA